MKLFVLGMLLLAACSATPDRDDGKPSPKEKVGIAPAPVGSDAAVFLRVREEGNMLVAEVVTRSTPALSGAALRLSFPSWLRFDQRDEASGWSADSVHHTKVGIANEVILVDTVKAKRAGHRAPAAGAESVLTTLYFTRDAQPAGELGALAFVPLRSELRDVEGKPVPVRYYDQAFSR